MATRLASQRANLITITQIPSQQSQGTNNVISENSDNEVIKHATISVCEEEHTKKDDLSLEKENPTSTASVSSNSLTLQQVIRQVCTKKKVLLQAGNDGEISVIDIVPIESSGSSESNPITVSLGSESPQDQTPQVTAQVAVVQAQSPADNGPQYITVTVSSPQDNIGNSQGTYHLQYVDSELYPSSQSQTQMAYPVYAVSDYPSSGQQYYATNGNSYNATATTSNGHTTGQYIVPVDEAILTTGSRNSPTSINTDISSYIQSQASQGNASTSENESPPNLTHATRVSPATVAWLMENYETAEGVSLPRSTLYNHYMRHCNDNKLDAVNAASFGKLIRSVFMGLRTRRLGTRGNSKYHYYGIRIKPGSNLNNAVDEKPVQSQSIHSTPRPAKRGGKTESYETCAQYLGDGTRAIPEFPLINTNSSLGFDLTHDDVDSFRSIYREHCEAFLDAIINLEFSTIEQLWREFWRTQDNNNVEECEEEKYLSKTKLFSLCQLKRIQDFMKQVDLTFYQNLVDVLIPNVLRPIPSSLTQAIRNFAKNLETWLTAAMNGCPDEVCKVKMASVSAFSQTLRRYTSLNHLAQAARAVLQNSAQIAQMLNDLNRVDFNNVQEQASWVCQCDPLLVQQLENDFKQALQQQNTLEQWASWLRYVVDTVLDYHRGKASFPKAARQFLLKWSFYSSMVIRDLTLRSAASFGSFHLIRLLYDEYMFYIVEHKVAEATQTTPIAVMSSYETLSLDTNHDEFEVTPYSNQEFEIKMEPCSKRMRSS